MEQAGTKPYQRRRFHRRLTTRLLLHISGWTMLFVLLVAAIGFYWAFVQEQDRYITALVANTEQRIERESCFFQRAEQSATTLAEGFRHRYALQANNPERVADYHDWYETTEPGVERLDVAFFEGTVANDRWYEHLSTFVGPRDEPLSDELKSRVIIAQNTLMDLAPAWADEFENHHFSMPENILTIYAPGNPWGRQADAELVMTDFGTVAATLQENNPERVGEWTGLYYDLSADYWTITYQLPVDVEGQHLVSASLDIALNQMFDRLVTMTGEHGMRLVFNQKEQLIAAPQEPDHTAKEAGTLSLDVLDDPLYAEAYRLLEAQRPAAGESQVIRDGPAGYLMIASLVPGPDWWHVTLYPYREIQRTAMFTPLRIVLVGVVLMVAILLLVYWIINRQVSRPLRQLSQAADLVGHQHYEQVSEGELIPQDTKSEVGLLARSLQDMARRLLDHRKELEREVRQRTAELAAANAELDRMAYLDGLTGLRNRRCFDRDLSAALKHTAHQPTALALADVDSFKKYNDHYGHEAGDQVLKQLASLLSQQSPGKVYRYGGEELAFILPVASESEAIHELTELRYQVQQLEIEHQHSPWSRVTLTFGVAMLTEGMTLSEAIQRADSALYRGKQLGGNQVVSERDGAI